MLKNIIFDLQSWYYLLLPRCFNFYTYLVSTNWKKCEKKHSLILLLLNPKIIIFQSANLVFASSDPYHLYPLPEYTSLASLDLSSDPSDGRDGSESSNRELTNSRETDLEIYYRIKTSGFQVSIGPSSSQNLLPDNQISSFDSSVVNDTSPHTCERIP